MYIILSSAGGLMLPKMVKRDHEVKKLTAKIKKLAAMEFV